MQAENSKVLTEKLNTLLKKEKELKQLQRKMKSL